MVGYGNHTPVLKKSMEAELPASCCRSPQEPQGSRGNPQTSGTPPPIPQGWIMEPRRQREGSVPAGSAGGGKPWRGVRRRGRISPCRSGLCRTVIRWRPSVLPAGLQVMSHMPFTSFRGSYILMPSLYSHGKGKTEPPNLKLFSISHKSFSDVFGNGRDGDQV